MVDEAIDQDPHRPPKDSRCFSSPPLPLFRQIVTYTVGVNRRHRKQIGSSWRKLNPVWQALMTLVYLHKGETFTELATGFGIGTATA